MIGAVRSLYVRIAVAALIAVTVSVLAFKELSWRLVEEPYSRFLNAAYEHQVSEAVAAYQRGGIEELRASLQRLNASFTSFNASFHVTTPSGIDLLTGEDFSRLVDVDAAGRAWHIENNRYVDVWSSSDRRYRMIKFGSDRTFTRWTAIPFYALMLAAIAVMSWWVAVGIVPPLRRMGEVAERFGHGELDARVRSAPANEIGRLGTAFNDMADRIQTLLNAERRLLQDVAHELRSPLARLNFSTDEARTADDRDAAIDRIQLDLDRLAILVTQLVEMTRAEGDPTGRARQDVDLDLLLAEVASSCATDSARRGITVQLSGRIEESLSGDREMIRWAVENVIRNAVRYTPAGTVVAVSALRRNDDAVITVRDHGPGVPDGALARIFEPFYRADESRSVSTGGIGLGLAIARRAVSVHNGTISAENVSPGLQVTIVLPLQRA